MPRSLTVNLNLTSQIRIAAQAGVVPARHCVGTPTTCNHPKANAKSRSGQGRGRGWRPIRSRNSPMDTSDLKFRCIIRTRIKLRRPGHQPGSATHSPTPVVSWPCACRNASTPGNTTVTQRGARSSSPRRNAPACDSAGASRPDCPPQRRFRPTPPVPAAACPATVHGFPQP